MSVALTNIEERINALKTRAIEAIDPSKKDTFFETYYSEYASWFQQYKEWINDLNEGSQAPKFKYETYRYCNTKKISLLETAARANYFYTKCSIGENLLLQLQAKKVEVDNKWCKKLDKLPKWVVGSEPTLPAPTEIGDTPEAPEEVIRAQSDVTKCQNRLKLLKEYYEKEMQRFETLMPARNSEEQQAQPLVFSSQSAATSSLSQVKEEKKEREGDKLEF